MAHASEEVGEPCSVSPMESLLAQSSDQDTAPSRVMSHAGTAASAEKSRTLVYDISDQDSLKPVEAFEDDFFTPPQTPYAILKFRQTMATQLEMLQSCLMTQYERDILLLQTESQQFCQPLLAYDRAGSTPETTLDQSLFFEESQSSTAERAQGLPPGLQQHSTEICPLDAQLSTASIPPQFDHANQVEQTKDNLAITSELTSGMAVCSSVWRDAMDSNVDILHSSQAELKLEDLQIAEAMTQSFSQRNSGSLQPAVECSNEVPKLPPLQSAVLEVPETDQKACECTPDALTDLDEHSSDQKETSSIPQLNSHQVEDLEVRKSVEGTRSCSLQEVQATTKGITLSHHDGNDGDDIYKSEQSQKKELKHSASVMTIGDSIGNYSEIFDEGALNRARTSGVFTDLTESEQKKLTKFQRVVAHPKFDLISGFFITVNALTYAFKLQLDGRFCEYALRSSSENFVDEDFVDHYSGSEQVFYILEVIFMCIFVAELSVRIAAYRIRTALRNRWIWFDFVVISFGAIDVLGSGMLGINTSTMRLFRFVRLIRVFKVLQTMTSFDSLFLLLKAIHASAHAMAFSFLLLMAIQTVTGMFMCELLQPFILDESVDVQIRENVYKHFGTFSRSMLTMFEIALANWVPTCRMLVEGVNEWWMIFYIVYRCMFCFAVLRVISAVFITETNRVLASDDDLTLMKLRRDKLLHQRKLDRLFRNMDLDGDGNVSWEELKLLLANHESSKYLASLGFEEHDFEKLFWLVDDSNGNGTISINKFVSKIGKLKGTSKTIDTLTLLKLAHRLEVLIQKAFKTQGLIDSKDKINEEVEDAVFADNSPERDVDSLIPQSKSSLF